MKVSRFKEQREDQLPAVILSLAMEAKMVEAQEAVVAAATDE